MDLLINRYYYYLLLLRTTIKVAIKVVSFETRGKIGSAVLCGVVSTNGR